MTKDDMFFREIPNNGGFAVMAGLSVLIDELKKYISIILIILMVHIICFLKEQGHRLQIFFRLLV